MSEKSNTTNSEQDRINGLKKGIFILFGLFILVSTFLVIALFTWKGLVDDHSALLDKHSNLVTKFEDLSETSKETEKSLNLKDEQYQGQVRKNEDLIDLNDELNGQIDEALNALKPEILENGDQCFARRGAIESEKMSIEFVHRSFFVGKGKQPSGYIDSLIRVYEDGKREFDGGVMYTSLDEKISYRLNTKFQVEPHPQKCSDYFKSLLGNYQAYYTGLHVIPSSQE